MSNLNLHAALYSCIFFGLTYLLCYSLETIWLPLLIGILYRQKDAPDISNATAEYTSDILMEQHGFNALKYIHAIPKVLIIKGILGFEISIALWMVYVNNVVSYIFIALIIYFSSFVFKYLNSWYKYYPVENLKELKQK